MAFHLKWFGVIFMATLVGMAMIDAETGSRGEAGAKLSLGTPSVNALEPTHDGE